MIQRNMPLLVNDPQSLQMILAQGYRVLLCTEDDLSDVLGPVLHPNLIKVSVLLPPYAVISAESNGDMATAFSNYVAYLSQSPTVVEMLQTIYLSAYIGTPICLYLGSEYNGLNSVKQLPQILSANFGLFFGSPGGIYEGLLTTTLRSMYLNHRISGNHVICYWPEDQAFDPYVLEQLYNEFHPPVVMTDMQSMNAYFKEMVNAMSGKMTNQFGQALYSPFMGGAPNAGGKQ